MGLLYLYTYMKTIKINHVGEYTSHMDPMGTQKSPNINHITRANNEPRPNSVPREKALPSRIVMKS